MSEAEGTELDEATPLDEDPDEGDTSGDTTVRPTAAELQAGDRITDGLPTGLGRESATVRGFRHVTGYGGQLVQVSTTAGMFTVRAGDRFRVRRPTG